MAFWFGVLIWLLTLASVVVLIQGVGSAPEAISEAGRSIDSQFMLTLVITGIVFVFAQVLLGYYIWKFRSGREGDVTYIHGNNKIEVGGMVIIGVVFVALAGLGQTAWAKLHVYPPEEEPMRIEVTGEQFAWNIRYPGPDGKFGERSHLLYDRERNPVGIVPEDPAGKDDFVLTGNLVVPKDRQIELVMGSKDVIHSFFMPALRIKQDSVPGLQIPLRFKAEQAGEYEVLCAELCGLGHYNMKAILEVLEPADYAAWFAERTAGNQ